MCGIGELCMDSQCSVTVPPVSAGPHGALWNGKACTAPGAPHCTNGGEKCRGDSPETSQPSPALLEVFKSHFIPVSFMLFVSKHCQICWKNIRKISWLITHISTRKTCIMV